MPTGYTEKLYEGKPQTFEEFALAVAHGMGALIVMRDSSPDSPIPVFKVSSYHRERREAAQAELDDLREHDLVWWVRHQREEAEGLQKAVAESNQRRAEIRARYEAMLQRVEEWVPPTTRARSMRAPRSRRHGSWNCSRSVRRSLVTLTGQR